MRHATAIVARRILAGAACLMLGVAHPARAAADPASCTTVRLSDIGWTDVTATTATAGALLARLGYTPMIRLLSLTVTYLSMQKGEVDAFLGDWEPSGAAAIGPYLAGPARPDGVVRIATNLTGARYTLAVPDYTFAAGLRGFSDIAHQPALHRRIYGIEPGNDGNELVNSMIASNRFGLGDFHLVESSEAGMLAQVGREVALHRPIVFLAWEPHPMNLRFHLRYLAGGDAVFGPNYGSATINTVTRPGYAQACPNVERLLRQIRFVPAEESRMMDQIANARRPQAEVAREFLAAHPDEVAHWLAGVTMRDGSAVGPAIAAGG